MKSENYSWEAELQDGSIITEGEYLHEAVRFSLIPKIPGLPRHDFVGIKMIKRFNRGFLQGLSGTLKEYVYCLVTESFRAYVRSDGTVLITTPEYELYL